ncbi:MAG: hypothetical protein KA210_01170 [Bacteroidia bacterium]|nr:hypothetical protein [Bacteroidia bacterium]
MKKIIYTLFIMSILLLLAFGTSLSKNKETLVLVTKTKTFIAGHIIKIEFSTTSKTIQPQLFIVHSYGKTILNCTNKDGKLTFKLPDVFSKKTGFVSWFLIVNNKNIFKGSFEIMPNDNTKTQIENYLGPRSILAGGKEFTMMVAVPCDGFDNPILENSTVTIKNQFLENITIHTQKTKNFIGWENIFSSNPSGKMLVSTECKNIATKEIETEIYPNIATDFSINYNRNHEYGDGNQITSLSTSIIRDNYNNIVIDGTMVSFIINTKNNYILKTFGTTINGIATGEILHPDHEDVYSVKAYVTGIAESNILQINYKPILATFNYAFSNENRKITVGPIKSFMNQLVPDGIKVILKIFQDDKLVSTLQKDTSKGMATFNISSAYYKAQKYRFEISSLGITQKTQTKSYDHN